MGFPAARPGQLYRPHNLYARIDIIESGTKTRNNACIPEGVWIPRNRFSYPTSQSCCGVAHETASEQTGSWGSFSVRSACAELRVTKYRLAGTALTQAICRDGIGHRRQLQDGGTASRITILNSSLAKVGLPPPALAMCRPAP